MKLSPFDFTVFSLEVFVLSSKASFSFNAVLRPRENMKFWRPCLKRVCLWHAIDCVNGKCASDIVAGFHKGRFCKGLILGTASILYGTIPSLKKQLQWGLEGSKAALGSVKKGCPGGMWKGFWPAVLDIRGIWYNFYEGLATGGIFKNTLDTSGIRKHLFLPACWAGPWRHKISCGMFGDRCCMGPPYQFL